MTDKNFSIRRTLPPWLSGLWGKTAVFSKIHARLTALILIVTIPLLVGITTFISVRAGAEIEANAEHDLMEDNDALATNISTWLELHTRNLQEISMLPDIVSMDAASQRPTLLAVAATHPNLFLVHTTDLNGINVARNDDDEMKDYHDRGWFLGAKSGAPVTLEVLISRTTGKPAINMSAPIRNEFGRIVGVASIVSALDEISNEVGMEIESGHSFSYIVDTNNRVVAHPDPAFTTDELRDLSEYPPVAMLREGQTGPITFTDENGDLWHAYISTMDNGWGIITQQLEADHATAAREFQRISILLIGIGTALMFALAWFTIRRTLQPIGTLTNTASAIAAGDLSQVAEVKSQDEIGILASTFNTMTSQLRDLIGSLEHRVAERTRVLSAVAEVGTAASTILDTDKLLQKVVDLAKERFGLYHTHIYLLNEAGDTLVLASGAGEAGRQMVAKGHSIPLDREQSLVARAARERKGVTVNDVTTAPDFLPNPLLPDTHSELAVPMMVGDQVIGVFDVQSDVIGRFTEADVAVQTTLASQVASAIQNARSFTQVEQQRRQNDLILGSAGEGIFGLDEKGNHTFVNPAAAEMLGYTIEELVGKHSHSMWHHTHADGTLFPSEECPIYLTINKGIRNQGEEYFIRKDGTGFDVRFSSVPIQEKDRTIGAVVTFADITQQKRDQEFTAQRARQQEAINLITQKIQGADTVESALQVAARELGRALGQKSTLVTLDAASRPTVSKSN